MLACELNTAKFDVSIYEKNGALGRKFLVAGEGGLNLTHSENQKNFITRYTPASFFENSFLHFSNKDFILWLNELGITTFVGSSGRVFPSRGIKPIEVLNTFLNKIKKNKVEIFTKHTLKKFSHENILYFESGSVLKEIKSDIIIFCLGGASWPVTGSDGIWTALIKEKGIQINPFKASNCSFKINWPDAIVSKIEGKVLKNISITCGGKIHLGEIVLTKTGIEGSGIYPLSPEIRIQLEEKKIAEIVLDFKPNLSLEKIQEKLNSKPSETNITEHLKKHLNLSNIHVQLLKSYLSKEDFLNNIILSKKVKEFKLLITETGPIEDAISTIGGIDLKEIDSNFQLKKLPECYAIGEMLDYDAPTGGYLLQSCFSMAKFLSDRLNSVTF